MKRDDMRAVRLEDKLLFVPMIAVNALYDWGEGETGQTSKSYVVGRELEQQSEKMGAFRVDLGPASGARSASVSTSWRGRFRLDQRRSISSFPRSGNPAFFSGSGRGKRDPRFRGGDGKGNRSPS